MNCGRNLSALYDYDGAGQENLLSDHSYVSKEYEFGSTVNLNLGIVQ